MKTLALIFGVFVLNLWSCQSCSEGVTTDEERIVSDAAVPFWREQQSGSESSRPEKQTPLVTGDEIRTSHYSDIESSELRTCGLRLDGTILCWTGYWEPLRAAAGTYVGIGSGEANSCGIDSDGRISCAADIVDDYLSSGIPAGNYKAVTGGRGFACALDAEGAVTCWGRNRRTTPRGLEGQFSQVEATGDNLCGLKGDGQVICTRLPPERPLELEGRFTQIAVGVDAICGVKAAGTVSCSEGMEMERAPNDNIRSVSTRGERACGILRDGTISCWGHADPSRSDPPEASYTDLSVGLGHVCALRDDGQVGCWGRGFDLGEPSLRPPDEVLIKALKIEPDKRQGEVRGVGISLEYLVKGGGIEAEPVLVARLKKGKELVGSSGSGELYRGERGEGKLLDRAILLTGKGSRWSSQELFLPFYAMRLVPGEYRVTLELDSECRIQRDAQPELVKTTIIDDTDERTLTIQKPPAKMVRLGIRSIEVAPGTYETTVLDPVRGAPDLQWRLRLDGAKIDTLYASSTVDDSFSAEWDETSDSIVLSEGDVVTLIVYDIDLASPDEVGRFQLDLEKLQELERGTALLQDSKVKKLEVGSLEIKVLKRFP